jgi:hypothetical protein
MPSQGVQRKLMASMGTIKLGFDVMDLKPAAATLAALPRFGADSETA